MAESVTVYVSLNLKNIKLCIDMIKCAVYLNSYLRSISIYLIFLRIAVLDQITEIISKSAH